MAAYLEKPASYAIEASGWDVNEDFFVELTEMHWTAGGGERLTLRHAVRVGAIIFLRLVHATALGPSFPVTYQVHSVRRSSAPNSWDLDLIELRSREARQKEGPLLVPEKNEELVEQPK